MGAKQQDRGGFAATLMEGRDIRHGARPVALGPKYG